MLQGLGGGEEGSDPAVRPALHAVPVCVVVDSRAIAGHAMTFVTCMCVVGRPRRRLDGAAACAYLHLVGTGCLEKLSDGHALFKRQVPLGVAQ